MAEEKKSKPRAAKTPAARAKSAKPAARSQAAAAKPRSQAKAAASPKAAAPAGQDGVTVRIEYYRSAIGRSWRQKEIIRGLGFTKLRQVVVRPDNPGIRGMVNKVPHLLRILEAGTDRQQSIPTAPAAQ